MSLKDKKLWLLDMDGTLYLGEQLFEKSKAFLEQIKKNGGRYIFLTNNSSKGTDKYIEKMHRLGIAAEASDFCTSLDATRDYLLENYRGKKIYTLGTQSFVNQLSQWGFPVTTTPDEDVDCLLMGFDTELTFTKLEDACKLLVKGVEYLATHPDVVCPAEFGSVPDCGSIAQILYNSTGRTPYFIGKPEARIANIAMKACGATAEQTVIVGDRLNTDIACGVNAGISTVLVFSGETTREGYTQSEVRAEYALSGVEEIYSMIK